MSENYEIILESQAVPLKECYEPFPDMPSGSGNYRYFNQPIEQIPGWNAGISQVLFHGKDKGLFWQDVPECVEVIECATVTPPEGSCSAEDYALNFKQRRIRPLQDLGNPPTNYSCDCIPLEEVDVVTCLTVENDKIILQRKKVYVLKTGIADEPCPDPTIECCSGNIPAPMTIQYNPDTKIWEYKSSSTT